MYYSYRFHWSGIRWNILVKKQFFLLFFRNFLPTTRRLSHVRLTIYCHAFFKVVDKQNTMGIPKYAQHNLAYFGRRSQLSTDLTLECSGWSKFRPQLHTDANSLFYLTETLWFLIHCEQTRNPLGKQISLTFIWMEHNPNNTYHAKLWFDQFCFPRQKVMMNQDTKLLRIQCCSWFIDIDFTFQ